MTDRARILVVDDELGPRESLRMILKPKYEIATAESGDAALKLMESFHPDLIFMDIKMPQMDGIELLRRIKRRDPSIEIVMITAYASLETVKNALTHGAFEYLIKPFSRQDLEETARRALARRQTELGTRTQLATLVEEMRALAGKTRELEEEARREQAEQSLRVIQLSILREISRGILGQLELGQLTSAVSAQLREALGYDEVVVHLGAAPTAAGADALVCPIRDDGAVVGHLVAANRAGSRPIDPRERELLEMLSDYLAVAIRNSSLYGQVTETKRSLEQIIRSAGDAIISVDREGRIQGWNPAAQRIFGLTAAQAIGRAITDLLPGGAYRDALAAMGASEAPAAFETSHRRDDGRTLNVAVTLSALIGREGALEGVLAMVRDITAQREMESQLHQSEKLTALGQMAGGIAHDFNNLLQAILGYAQLMGKNPGNPDVIRRGLDVIEKAAAGGAETVRRIQKFSRLRPEDPFVTVDIDQVVRDSLAITRPRWEEKAVKGGIPLRLDLDLGSPPAVLGRPAELSEVITNLILNAIDAMPAGGTLSIRTRRESERHVILTVSDTGIGMSDEVQKRIFDPFFTTKGEHGTGLGLPVSYSIVKRHGGEVRVESQPGGGSTFTVTLPVGIVVRSEPVPVARTNGTRKGRILLVDNDPQVMTILSEMLADGGHQVTAALSGEEAVRAFAPGRFDLIITNLGMPGMNGWEVANRLRASDPRLPIIFITGWGMQEEDQARCRGLGVAALLFKPVRPAELHAAVEEVLVSRAGAARPPVATSP
jgi:PAS domain S-box-containing protein